MKKSNYPSEEYKLLDALKKRLNFTPGKYFQAGIGDDAAVRQCGRDEQLIFTADVLVEGVHFSFDYMTPQEIGFRAMVANISDCAAMGAIPDSALVQIVFPAGKESKDTLLDIYSGIEGACRKWDFPVVGGDLSQGPCWMIAVSLTGRKKKEARILTRSGIKLGDTVWVTGIPGMSAAGLDALRRWKRSTIPEAFQKFTDCHIQPEAQIEAGMKLSEDSTVHACIDLSDGIAKECYTLCYENDVGMELTPKEDDISSVFRDLEKELSKPWYDWFLYGGEDYELLFTASKEFDPLQHGLSCYKIGTVTEKKNNVTINLSGNRVAVEKKAWDHFQQ